MADTMRMKRPPFSSSGDELTGRVQYDDRGNAIWKWKDEETAAEQLARPRLSIVGQVEPIGLNAENVDSAAGYNPYGSGLVVGTEPKSARKDLRALSKWIELKRQRGEKPNG
jgi:hypothetical protein